MTARELGREIIERCAEDPTLHPGMLLFARLLELGRPDLADAWSAECRARFEARLAADRASKRGRRLPGGGGMWRCRRCADASLPPRPRDRLCDLCRADDRRSASP